MNLSDVAFKRLGNQQFNGSQFTNPADLVSWLGAVQAQDYGAAKWALGLRLPASTDAMMEQAFNGGHILRTHVMRPTWHFVTPTDIRWMLELTAPRVNALAAYYYRQLELDESLFRRCEQMMISALEGGHQLTRDELAALFKQDGINIDDLRATYLVGWAELNGSICSGARRGKQHTYALLSERAPQAKSLPRDQAIVELARRYFISHGPATVQDFVWWSGLLMVDAKAGVDALKSELACDVIDDQTYWFAPTTTVIPTQSPTAHLLPNYDEYTVGYGDRSAVFAGDPPNHLDPRGSVLLNYVIIYEGQAISAWRRTFKKGRVIIELKPFAPLSDLQTLAIQEAAQRYADFLGLGLEIV